MTTTTQQGHTAGPWKVGSLATSIVGDSGVPIATTDVHRHTATLTDISNAHLIAAAPDLLKVCEMMLSGNYTRLVPMEIAEAARAAISKATTA